MEAFIIFEPLKNRKSLRLGILATILIFFVYILINIALFMFSIGFNTMPFNDLVQFAIFKSFTSFTSSEWIFLILFPLVGGLLFANYNYWKCSPDKLTYSGILLGFISTACIACILPALGLAAFATAASHVNQIVKYATLTLLVVATYYVALKQNKCKIDKK